MLIDLSVFLRQNLCLFHVVLLTARLENPELTNKVDNLLYDTTQRDCCCRG